MSIATTEYEEGQRLASYMSLASTMTIDDLRRETWRLWDCEPSGDPNRRESLRLALVELQLEIERLSLRVPDRSEPPAALTLEMHAQHLLELRDAWRIDPALTYGEAA